MWNSCQSDNAREYRSKQRNATIPYGITYLDKALGGIRPTDLVFIGARSGSGKTELATMLVQNCSSFGKQVYYFALEADRGEIENRIVYREFAKIYYQDHKYKVMYPINYRDFSDGKYDSQYSDIISQADKIVDQKMRNVEIMYREESFTADDFERHVNEIKDHADIIILDHIHHINMDIDNETAELKKVVKRLRDINILIEKPIVCIAHFKKSDRRTAELVAGFDEFYGSSEISKEATQVITIAGIPAEMIGGEVPYNISPTLFRISKFRRFSPVTKYVGLVMYDNRSNVYQSGFQVYTLAKAGQEIVPVENIPEFLVDVPIREIQDAFVE